MDEDILKNELVKLLQSIREGTPEAFSMVVEEVSRYNLFIGILQMIAGVGLSMLCVWGLKKLPTLNWNDEDQIPVCIISMVGVIVAGVVALIALVNGTENSAVGISPMGWLVTNMVK